jgi:hypothetical protein
MRRLLNYSNVMSTIAVCLALGGSSYAALKLGAGSVTGKQIKNGSITLNKLSQSARNALRSPGPPGPPGPKGDAGAPGSALAYARVQADDTLDSAASKNVTITNSVSNFPVAAYVCFGVVGSPKNVVASIDVSGADSRSTVAGTVDPATVQANCPSGSNAIVFTLDKMKNSASEAFYVVFN